MGQHIEIMWYDSPQLPSLSLIPPSEPFSVTDSLKVLHPYLYFHTKDKWLAFRKNTVNTLFNYLASLRTWILAFGEDLPKMFSGTHFPPDTRLGSDLSASGASFGNRSVPESLTPSSGYLRLNSCLNSAVLPSPTKIKTSPEIKNKKRKSTYPFPLILWKCKKANLRMSTFWNHEGSSGLLPALVSLGFKALMAFCSLLCTPNDFPFAPKTYFNLVFNLFRRTPECLLLTINTNNTWEGPNCVL